MKETEIKVQDIDKRLSLPTTIEKDDIQFYDIRTAPFEIYGLYNPTELDQFWRMPEEVAKNTSRGVLHLAKNTAGGRVRFSTNSKYIAIKVIMDNPCHMYHMTTCGSAGFDLYTDTENGSYFSGVLAPSPDFKGGEYETYVEFSGEPALRSYTLNFPLYSGVTAVYVGLQKDAVLTPGRKYKFEKPVVYYGSSITQGGCASRPGNAYQHIITRKYDLDHINLGFSGSGCGEDSMAQYMASLDMLIFVSDYDHNSCLKDLESTHWNLYKTIREKHKDLPYIMISRPDFIGIGSEVNESVLRRNCIMRNYIKGIESGDKNLYFIDGESLFEGHYGDSCTVDGTHPNDLGFAMMADRIGDTIHRILMHL